MSHVLVVTSSHPELGGEPNGTYMPELTHALHVLDEHKISYDIVSPKGGRLPSYGDDADELTKTMLADSAFAAKLITTELADVDPSKYDAVYYPGGYGLLFDLVDDADSHRVAKSFFARNAPVAAVCHGPAALSRIALDDGTFMIKDRDVTGFTRSEEVAMKTLESIPFLLEDAMTDAGGVYRKMAAWAVHVVEDGPLITGQNPPSAAAVGQALAVRLTS
ncbi:MAG: putative intracellular protease/amidase [Myxococcota bacterium]|jgi:putative intracellular protease/amidase